MKSPFNDDKVQMLLNTYFPNRTILRSRWNGAEWETETTETRRHIRALTAHIRDLETRYTALENRLNAHANGQTHRAKAPKLPDPDVEK